MQDGSIRSLSLTGNCMQSEGELRFCISLYEIFCNLDIKTLKKEGVSPDKAAEVFLGVMNVSVAAQACEDAEYIMDEFGDYEDEDEDNDE